MPPTQASQVLLDVYMRYLQGKREFIDETERCTLKGWPDRRSEIRETFELQRHYIEREVRRIRYVAESDARLDRKGVSLASIATRIDKDWTAADDAGLVAKDPSYVRTTEEINRILGLRGSITEPLRDASSDPDYLRARQKFSELVQALDEELSGISK